MTSTPFNPSNGPRHLDVQWSDHAWTLPSVFGVQRATIREGRALRVPDSISLPLHSAGDRTKFASNYSLLHRHPRNRRWNPGFTILELLLVITIIGFLAALALPHLGGMTHANSMSAATRQLLDDVALARQLATANRSTVYMVFVPPNVTPGGPPINDVAAFNNLLNHQCTAYALVSLHSVGDQPGRSYPRYLTDWKTLPDGIIIAPFMFTNLTSVTISSTNTLTPPPNNIVLNTIFPFTWLNNVPFPAENATNALGQPYTLALPAIGFNSHGQLTTNFDQYIPLASGSVFYLPGAVSINESPPGNDINNCNLIHIDWLTARSKIERNQF